MNGHLMRGLLALYPRAFRDRYGAELASVTDERISAGELTPLLAALNLACGAALEWGRVLFHSRRTVLAMAVAAIMAVAGSLYVASHVRPQSNAHPRTLAQSYHLTQTTGMYYISSGGRITNRFQLTCTIQADPVRQLEASFCANGMAQRQVGRYTYHYFTALAGHAVKHWQRFPAASPGWGVDDCTVTATPQQILSLIKKAYKVTVIGPVSGPGWIGTRYAVASRQAAGLRLSGTVEVDRQGRARALVLTMRSGPIYHSVMTQVLTFSDFGTPVTVTPPPADQTLIAVFAGGYLKMVPDR